MREWRKEIWIVGYEGAIRGAGLGFLEAREVRVGAASAELRGGWQGGRGWWHGEVRERLARRAACMAGFAAMAGWGSRYRTRRVRLGDTGPRGGVARGNVR